MKNRKKYQESKWKYKVASLIIKITTLYYDRPRIKPPQIGNRDKFPGISNRDGDLLRLTHGIFPSANTLLFINLLITTN